MLLCLCVCVCVCIYIYTYIYFFQYFCGRLEQAFFCSSVFFFFLVYYYLYILLLIYIFVLQFWIIMNIKYSKYNKTTHYAVNIKAKKRSLQSMFFLGMTCKSTILWLCEWIWADGPVWLCSGWACPWWRRCRREWWTSLGANPRTELPPYSHPADYAPSPETQSNNPPHLCPLKERVTVSKISPKTSKFSKINMKLNSLP